MAIEMLVVKTAWILSFILSSLRGEVGHGDEEDEKDEDRATHCSRQSQMSSYSRENSLGVRWGGQSRPAPDRPWFLQSIIGRKVTQSLRVNTL